MILTFFLNKLINPILRSRLRAMMRGYRSLKKAGQLNRIPLLKEMLTDSKFVLKEVDFSSLIMGSGKHCGEVIIRQYALMRIGGHSLNAALLRSLGEKNGKVVYPLPREWREIIQQHGFRVDFLKSTVLWQLYIFGALLYGMLIAIKIMCIGFGSIRCQPIKQPKYVYFERLTAKNLPLEKNNHRSHDVISWYLQWKDKKSDIKAICHGVSSASAQFISGIKIYYQSGPLPALSTWNSFLKYFFWCFCALLFSTLEFIRGRWWHAFILNQAAFSAQVRCIEKKSLASDYLFHNSGPIYRPLWTYEAETNGARIIFYFYSTNSENFKTSECDASIPFGWRAMTWPHFLVWNKWQELFIRKSIGYEARVQIVGPIWFSTSAIGCIPDRRNLITVFDVQPTRDSIYQTFGLGYEYYLPRVAKQFLSDIEFLALNTNLNIAFKRKRNVGKLTPLGYLHKFNELKKLPNFIEVDADLSATSLIEKSIAVISMPFTSTALIARELGRPTIFYDPTGLLRADDPAAHGISLIKNIEDLRKWIEVIVGQQHREAI